ncbi:SET domain-containing protein 4 [Planoprotostelium fungivorum]|uniref:SET domain-containing protein 4 n=1 Tax=Planoprotostelium fungivorum TaxID=1890364 RepID=A0A2P6N821_9EUKA|nr:SET domain-containing protein 4 [Planoprotostelium fungivorum]
MGDEATSGAGFKNWVQQLGIDVNQGGNISQKLAVVLAQTKPSKCPHLGEWSQANVSKLLHPAQTFNTPLFWTEEEIQCIQNPATISENICGVRRLINPTAKIRDTIRQNVQRTEFHWAWTAVMTRCLHIDVSSLTQFKKLRGLCFEGSDEWSKNYYGLAPFFDGFNHSFVQVEGMYDERKREYRLIARQEWKEGEQVRESLWTSLTDEVFICYGPHSNSTILLEYGFVLPNNPNSRVDLSIEEQMDDREYTEEKKKILESFGLSTSRTENIFISSTGPSWNLLSTLRVLFLSSEEITLSDRILEERPVSDKNESLVKAYCAEMIRRWMKDHETTPEEDERLLSRGGTENARNAVSLRMEEKRIMLAALKEMEE